jgi:Fe2+ transport system protein B
MNVQFKNLKFIIVLSLIVFLFPSCSITKCRYSNGFNLNLNTGFKKENKDKKEWLANKANKPKSKNSLKITETKRLQNSTQVDSLQAKEMTQNLKIVDDVKAFIQEDKIEKTKLMSFGNGIKDLEQFKGKVVSKEKKRIHKMLEKVKQKENSFWDTWLGNALIEVATFILGLVLFLGIMYFVLMFETFSLPLQFLLIVIGLILFMIILSDLFNSATDAVFDIFTR